MFTSSFAGRICQHWDITSARRGNKWLFLLHSNSFNSILTWKVVLITPMPAFVISVRRSLANIIWLLWFNAQFSVIFFSLFIVFSAQLRALNKTCTLTQCAFVATPIVFFLSFSLSLYVLHNFISSLSLSLLQSIFVKRHSACGAIKNNQVPTIYT